ncbi:MAG TPA: DUF6458 family protein [Micromonosporaceae bacterium]|jgi:hypothetical protein
MGIGASIFLIVVGAIFTFALDVRVGGLDLDALGWILMIAGAVGFVLTWLLWGNRRRTIVTTRPVSWYRRQPRTYAEVEPEPTTYTRVEEERRDIDPL